MTRLLRAALVAVLTPLLALGSGLVGPSTADADTAAASTAGVTSAVRMTTSVTVNREPGLRGVRLYRNPDRHAIRDLRLLQRRSPARYRLLARAAAQPQAIWLGDWIGNSRIRARTAQLTTAAARARSVPVFVLYNIPLRDCSSYSGGGARSAAEYRRFVDQLARGIGRRRAAVIVEPDALAHISCLSPAGQRARIALIAWAVRRLSALPGTAVYLDAGHRHWQSPRTMAVRLRAAGIARARGFSLNVANFDTTTSELAYGREISALVGGKPFVIDTGRNGRGAAGGSQAWCNPPGRALGPRPTTRVADPLVDALLWVKRVGESDGSCRRGAPSAGRWWLSYLLGMSYRARW